MNKETIELYRERICTTSTNDLMEKWHNEAVILDKIIEWSNLSVLKNNGGGNYIKNTFKKVYKHIVRQELEKGKTYQLQGMGGMDSNNKPTSVPALKMTTQETVFYLDIYWQ